MVLIVNLGLKSIRIIVFDASGNQLYSSSKPVHTILLGDHVEQDPKEWLSLLSELLNELKVMTNLTQSIRYITSTTSSSCIVGLDEQGNPVTNVMMVSDKRAVAETEVIRATLEFNELNALNSVPCTSSMMAPKAMWIKRHHPKIFDSVSHWLGAGEFLNYFFTHEWITDPLNATKSFYSDGAYPKDLFESIGLNITTMPRVDPIGSKYPVSSSVKSSFSFDNSCEYILTTYDAICAVIGSSTGETGNACDVSGTVTSVRILSKHPIRSKSPLLLNQQLDVFNSYIIGSSNNLGGGLIEWYKQAFFSSDEDDVYFKMENYAQQARVGASGIIFLPFLLGERSPFLLPDAKGTFFGISRNSTIIDFTRAVFESAGYVTRGLLELIQRENVRVDTITVSGGMSRFDTINQIKSDVTNTPILVVENYESTSIGAYIILCCTLGIFSSLSEATKQSVRIRKIIQPSERNHALYQEYYSTYLRINDALTPLYPAHGQLLKKHHDVKNEVVRNL